MNRDTHSSFKRALISYLRNSNAEFLKYIIIFTATFLYQMMKCAKIFGARLNNDCLLRKSVLNRDRRFNINSVSCHIVCVNNNMNECVIRIISCAFKFAHKIMKKCAEFGQIGSFFPTIICNIRDRAIILNRKFNNKFVAQSMIQRPFRVRPLTKNIINIFTSGIAIRIQIYIIFHSLFVIFRKQFSKIQIHLLYLLYSLYIYYIIFFIKNQIGTITST